MHSNGPLPPSIMDDGNDSNDGQPSAFRQGPNDSNDGHWHYPIPPEQLHQVIPGPRAVWSIAAIEAAECPVTVAAAVATSNASLCSPSTIPV